MIFKEKENNIVSAVIYCHNSESDIEEFLEVLYRIFEKYYKIYEFIIVNDASTDGTIDLIRPFSKLKSNNIMTIINMSYFQGVEKAMNAGVDHAIGDYVFEFDGIEIDYEDELIFEIYIHALTGYDIVSARNTKQKLTSRIFYFLFNTYSKNQYQIGSDSFRVLSRRAINRIHSLFSAIPYRKALYVNSGLKNDVITYVSTLNSKSNHSLKSHRSETALNTLLIFTDMAYKLALGLSILMMFSTIAILLYVIVFFLLGGSVEGFTTIMLFLNVAFFMVFAIFTILTKYLSVLVNLIFLKQKYFVQSIEKVKVI